MQRMSQQKKRILHIQNSIEGKDFRWYIPSRHRSSDGTWPWLWSGRENHDLGAGPILVAWMSVQAGHHFSWSTPEQTEQALVTPSQKRVSQGKKYLVNNVRTWSQAWKILWAKGGVEKKRASTWMEDQRIKIDRHSRPRIKSPRGLESLSRIIMLSCNIWWKSYLSCRMRKGHEVG